MKRILVCILSAALFAAMTSPVKADETIKIGVAGAHSGDLASYGVPSLNASKLVIEAQNAKGGVLGKKIELISQDDQCKPELATNVATKLLSDKVAAVMGHICSGATKAAQPLYNESKIVAVSPSATTPGLTAGGVNPMFFRTIARDDQQAQLTSAFVHKELKAKTVAYIHDNGDYGKGFADNNKDLLEPLGVKTVLFEAITPDAVDFTSIVQKIKKSKADVIIFGGYQNVASKLLQQLRKKMPKIPFVGPDGLKDEALVKMAGKAAEGVYCSYPKDTSSLPIYKLARTSHIEKFGSEPGSFYYNAYSAMLAIINAIEKSGSTETAKIIEALRTQPVETPIGTITFGKNGDAIGLGLSVYKVEGGKFVETPYNVTLK